MKYKFKVDYMSENDISIFKDQIVEVKTVFDNENGKPDCLIIWDEKQDDGSFTKYETYITLEALQFCAEIYTEKQKNVDCNKCIRWKNCLVTNYHNMGIAHCSRYLETCFYLTDEDIENVCKKCMKNSNKCSNVNQREKCKWNFDEEGKPKKEIKGTDYVSR